MKPFFVYMLRCADGSYYVGHTDELEQRVAQHQSGEIEGYTRVRRPVEVVWAQETTTREEALAAELRIKGWSRAKKEALIRGDWTQIQRHAWGTRNPLPEHLRGEPSTVQPEVSKARAGGDGASIPQPERSGEAGEGPTVQRGLPSTAQPEVSKARASGDGASIPQPERGEEAGEGPTVQRGLPSTAQPEVSKAHAGGDGASIPQPERSGEAGEGPTVQRGLPSTVQPEVSKARASGGGASIPQPERGEEAGEGSTVQRGRLSTVQPEVSKARSYADQVRAGHRRGIAKAITLLESTRSDDRAEADSLLNTLLPHTGRALRLGISGVPGVGKSTFIEALGLLLIDRGHKVAVLTIDPSSMISGGSILGDKTRMEKLSVHDAAYIRPSPASGTLGGVAEKTREAMLVCEAAGYDVVIVETVGVGQSETAVASMTDMFVLLQLPNAGDDLQAIKKGVMEIADLVVINKADLDPDAATRAEATITSALRIFSFHGHAAHWTPKVMQISALKGQNIDTFWQQVEQFQQQRGASGEFEARRKRQALAWMWDIIQARLQADFKHHPAVREALPQALRDVAEARIAPSSAARSLLDRFERD